MSAYTDFVKAVQGTTNLRGFYVFDEPSGNVVDYSTNGNTLSVGGASPTNQIITRGRPGVIKGHATCTEVNADWSRVPPGTNFGSLSKITFNNGGVTSTWSMDIWLENIRPTGDQVLFHYATDTYVNEVVVGIDSSGLLFTELFDEARHTYTAPSKYNDTFFGVGRKRISLNYSSVTGIVDVYLDRAEALAFSVANTIKTGTDTDGYLLVGNEQTSKTVHGVLPFYGNIASLAWWRSTVISAQWQQIWDQAIDPSLYPHYTVVESTTTPNKKPVITFSPVAGVVSRSAPIAVTVTAASMTDTAIVANYTGGRSDQVMAGAVASGQYSVAVDNSVDGQTTYTVTPLYTWVEDFSLQVTAFTDSHSTDTSSAYTLTAAEYPPSMQPEY